jgi:hypothetical protein
MPIPDSPTPAVVSDFLRRWERLENYTLQERSLALLFHKLCPENTELEHVLLKVSALNDFYSTNIFDTYTVAKHILNLNVDSRLARGDLSLVNALAKVSIRQKAKNFYSFASKYCSHHRPEQFPIYDSYVDKMLMHFSRASQFTSFCKADLKQYERFVQIVGEFQRHFGLHKFSLREIDIYLWLAGKKSFPPKYARA